MLFVQNPDPDLPLPYTQSSCILYMLFSCFYLERIFLCDFYPDLILFARFSFTEFFTLFSSSLLPFLSLLILLRFLISSIFLHHSPFLYSLLLLLLHIYHSTPSPLRPSLPLPPPSLPSSPSLPPSLPSSQISHILFIFVLTCVPQRYQAGEPSD